MNRKLLSPLLLMCTCLFTSCSLVSTAPVTATAQPPTPTSESPCAYVPSTQNLPDTAKTVAQALQQAGYGEVQVRASAYGESCVDSSTNQSRGFSAMQTDLFFSVPVKDASEAQTMGEWTEKLAVLVAGLPAGQLPGSNPGYIGILFDDGKQKANLWSPRARIKELLDQGKKGGELYNALQNP